MAAYQAPSRVPADEYAYGGNWSIGSEASTAGTGRQLSLDFQAKDVYLVLGGSGTVRVSVNGTPTQTVTVGGEPRLYQLVGSSISRTGAAVPGRRRPGCRPTTSPSASGRRCAAPARRRPDRQAGGRGVGR